MSVCYSILSYILITYSSVGWCDYQTLFFISDERVAVKFRMLSKFESPV